MELNLYKTRLLLLMAAAVTLSVYWPGLPGPFVFDDFSNTTEIHLRVLDWEHLADVAFSNASGPLLRPLANASFALNYYFFGFEPYSYKLINLLIHVLCGLLVFALVRRILAALDYDDNTVRTAALLAAAGWLLHPLQVSTVLYAVQRMAQLSALFTLAALWAYIAGRERLAAGHRRGWWFMGLAFGVLSPLALASKENAALIPVFVLVLEFFVYRFRCQTTKTKPDLACIWIVGIALPLFLGALYVITHFSYFLNAYDLRPFTMTERLLTQPRVLWFYVYLILAPFPENLGFYHDDFDVSRGIDAGVVTALGGLAFLVIAMLVLRRRAPVVSFGIAWFLAAHALESSFVGLELVFEHRNYLALLGPAIIVGWGASRITSHMFTSDALRLVALAAPLALLIGLTWVQVQRWSSIHDFLASHALNKPESPRANAELAAYYARIGDWDQADGYLLRFEALIPDDPAVPLMRIQLRCRQSSIDEAIVDSAVAVVGTAPGIGHLPQKLTLLTRQWLRPDECPGLPAQQLLRIIDATLMRTEMETLQRVAANLNGFRGVILRRLGQNEQAIDAFTAAITITPEDVDLLLLRAYAELSLRRYEALDRSISRLRDADASSLRHSTHRIDELATSVHEARSLEELLTRLGNTCGENPWPATDVVKTRGLLGTSDAVWVVLPLLQQLIATVISTPCVSATGKDTLGLLDSIEDNGNLPEYRPGRSELSVLRARLMSAQGKLEEALAAYGQALEMAPESFQTLYEMAYLQLNTGLLDEARETVQRMRSLESVAEPGNDSRLVELQRYIDRAGQ